MVAFVKATKEAKILLSRLAVSCRKDANCHGFEVLQQIGAPNHLTVIQDWTTAGAFEAHEADNEVREIRTKLQPILGSPIDERVHHRLR